MVLGFNKLRCCLYAHGWVIRDLHSANMIVRMEWRIGVLGIAVFENRDPSVQ